MASLQLAINRGAKIEATVEAAAGCGRAAGVKPQNLARVGVPGDGISDVYEESGADLIVRGSRGVTGARPFLLRSAPNKVSQNALCPAPSVMTT